MKYLVSLFSLFILLGCNKETIVTPIPTDEIINTSQDVKFVVYANLGSLTFVETSLTVDTIQHIWTQDNMFAEFTYNVNKGEYIDVTSYGLNCVIFIDVITDTDSIRITDEDEDNVIHYLFEN